MSLARIFHAVNNRIGRLVARVVPSSPEQFNNATGKFEKVVLVANRWEYGSRLGLPGYEYRRFLPSLNELSRSVLFVPIEMRSGIIAAIRNRNEKLSNLPVISVFQNYSDIPETYFQLKDAGCKLINWYTDDDMHFEKFGSRVANSFDLNVTTFSPNAEKFSELGAEVVVSQWAGLDGVEFQAKKNYLAAFIGRLYGKRAELAERLKRRYGERIVVSDTRVSSMTDEKMVQIYRESLLAIDEPTAYDGKNLQIKARIFENASMGCAVVTKFNSRLEQYFRKDEEILFYQDYDALIQILDDAEERPDHYLNVAHAAYKRARSEHTYEKRFTELLERIAEGCG